MEFRTLTDISEGFFKEKGSKFLSFAFPVQNEDDVKKNLELLRKKFHDARHHCYAYQIGMKDIQTRANDDGEPNHSAGDPILGQIRSFELTNTLVVVVRYFGGTKLGVSGLIAAYKTAAEEALKNAKTTFIYPKKQFEIPFQYDQTAEVEKLLHGKELDILKREFTDSCLITAEIKEELFPDFKAEAESFRIPINSLSEQD